MKEKVSLLFALGILGILLIRIVSAQSTQTCCEMTTAGAWCQNVNDPSLCDTTSINSATGQPYRVAPAVCEETSYCQLGTCVDPIQGSCFTSPQISCVANGGYWNDTPEASMPQCQLGCCLTGDEAAFVTQANCNVLAAQYGVTVDFMPNVQNEEQCLASASPNEEGACVFTQNYTTTCTLTTNQNCQSMIKAQSGVTFHPGLLCSAQILGTICAPSKQTECGQDDNVYFVDTCGNLANIYDASKVNDSNYWTYIQGSTCTDNSGDKNSKTCGACDYLSGSMCGQSSPSNIPDYGNYVCNDLDCTNYTKDSQFTYSGPGYPQQGDTWCETDNKDGGNTTSPGGTYFKMMCYNGQVTSEECGSGDEGSTRQEVCIEDSATRTGNCKVNVWEDCYSQTDQKDCDNIYVRDCTWITNVYSDNVDSNSSPCNPGIRPSLVLGASGVTACENTSLITFVNSTGFNTTGACVPAYPPGFDNESATNGVAGGALCSLADVQVYVHYQRPLLGQIVGGNWSCTENCNVKSDPNATSANPAWIDMMNGLCTHMGDCGNKVNYIGVEGDDFSNASVQNCAEGTNRSGDGC